MKTETAEVKVPLSEAKLRDWFAAQALVGLVSNSGVLNDDEREYATAAYRLADAMLEERAK